MEGNDDGHHDQHQQGGKKRPNDNQGDYAGPQKKGFFNGETIWKVKLNKQVLDSLHIIIDFFIVL